MQNWIISQRMVIFFRTFNKLISMIAKCIAHFDNTEILSAKSHINTKNNNN